MAGPTKTYSFTNGTTADADEVNENFDDVLSGLSAGSSGWDLNVGDITGAGTTYLTSLQLRDSADTYHYIFDTKGLAADQTMIVGTLTTANSFIFDQQTQTISNKILDTPQITTGALIKAEGYLRFEDATGGEYVGFKAPTAATTTTYTLPSADGTASYFLQTNGSGVLSWAAAISNPMTTTGDIIYSSSGSTPARLAVGSEDDVLQVSSGGIPEWTSTPNFTNATIAGTLGIGASTSPNATLSIVTSGTEATPSSSADNLLIQDSTASGTAAGVSIICGLTGISTLAFGTTGNTAESYIQHDFSSNNFIINSITNDPINFIGTGGTRLYYESSTANTENIFRFDLQNSSSAQTGYAQISAEIITNTAASEDGALHLYTMSGGTLTKQVTVSEAGNVAILNGTLTVSGNVTAPGVDFSTTGTAGTSTSTLLDEYDEGTWTATASNVSNTSVSTFNSGKYTRIGRMVYCYCDIDVNVVTPGTATTIVNTYISTPVSSLPYTPVANTLAGTVNQVSDANNRGHIVISSSGTLVYFNLFISADTDTEEWSCVFSYETSD